MNPASSKTEIDALVDSLNDHAHRYYVLAKPVISDAEYDRLYRRLEELEKKHPELVREDSPTKRVGGLPLPGFPTVRHRVPMLSLNNAMNAEEVTEFDAQVRRFLDGRGESVAYTVEHKFDGVAVTVGYRDGLLVSGATRGDGF